MNISNSVCNKIIIPKDEISNKVAELGRQITEDYTGKEVVFISILNGAFMFTADLLKSVDLDCYIDFMQVSTYGNETKSTGTFVVKKDLTIDIEGKDVIIIEDILDTGYTLSNLKGYLAKKNPASTKIVTFIDKPIRRKIDINADYVGFVLNEDYFIVGYGLDYAQKYRNLPYVGVLNEELYS